MKTLKYIFVLIINIVLLSTSSAQTIDELSSTIAFLSEKLPNNKVQYGTGFFVSSEKNLYLITAQHVSNFLTINSNITIRTENDIPFKLKFTDIINTTKLNWKYHSEGDIALLYLFPSDSILQKLEKHFLTLSHIYSKKTSLSREITITILGFPLQLGTQGLFSPISRETKPASGFLSLPRADTKNIATFFISQDPSIGGFSGAPVFDLGQPIQSTSKLIIRGMEPQVVGLVHGTISDETGGKLGAIVPSYQIYGLIEKYDK